MNHIWSCKKNISAETIGMVPFPSGQCYHRSEPGTTATQSRLVAGEPRAIPRGCHCQKLESRRRCWHGFAVHELYFSLAHSPPQQNCWSASLATKLITTLHRSNGIWTRKPRLSTRPTRGSPPQLSLHTMNPPEKRKCSSGTLLRTPYTIPITDIFQNKL